MAKDRSDSERPKVPSRPPMLALTQEDTLPKPTYAAAPKPAAVACALEVRIDVSQHNWNKFERLGVEFHPIFTAAGLILEYAMYGEPYMKDGELYYVVYNYWRVGNDLNTFVNASLTLPDNPAFGALDGVLEVEIKNVVIPIGPRREDLPGVKPRPIEVPHPGIGDQSRYATGVERQHAPLHYIRVVSKLETHHAAEYAALVEESLRSFAKEQGWTLGESFFFLTGADETVVQIWRADGPPAGGIAEVLRRLKKSRWHKLTKIMSIELLKSTAYDTDIS